MPTNAPPALEEPCHDSPKACSTTLLTWREAHLWHERHRLEQLVQHRFASEHGARITHFLPRLFGLWQDDHPHAAVGVGAAASGPLFQERYLDAPIEALLSARFDQQVDRVSIAEIGNLATERPGLQRRLFLHLVETLTEEGVAWLLFTATPEVHNGIRRLGLVPQPLMPADPRRLGSEHAAWGRYYDRRPWVITGDLRLAHKALTAYGLLPLSCSREVTYAQGD